MSKFLSLAVFALSLLFGHGAGAKSPAPQQGPSDLYFLAVGAGNHRDNDFPSLEAAANSARLVARSLSDAGARFGIVLTSKPNGSHYVTRRDFLEAMKRLKSKIRRDNSKAPRILVYLIMHGAADDASDYLFMVPDDLVLDQDLVEQKYVFRLAKRSIWNLDILTSLMNFRLDDRLSWLDNFTYSTLLSDKLGPLGNLEQLLGLQKLDREFARRSNTYGTAPFDNAPVPFVLLMDNCTDGVDYTLVKPNPTLDLFGNATNTATLDGGRAFYAVKPGQVATTLELPKILSTEADLIPGIGGRRVRPIVGPLAVHLRNILSKRGHQSMTLGAFSQRLSESGRDTPEYLLPEPAFQVRASLRKDVASVDFIPKAGHHKTEVVTMAPTGTTQVSCCVNID